MLPRSLLAPLLAAPDAVQGAMVSHKTAFGQLMADHMLALKQIKRLPDFATFIDTSFVDAVKPT